MVLFPGSGSVSLWLEQLKEGDDDAVHRLWQRYFDSLTRLAQQKLSRRVTGAFDEEDVAVSVFDSLVKGARLGNFPQLHDRNDLWRLLFVLTVRQSATKATYENRLKRGRASTLRESDLGGAENQAGLDQLLSKAPSPEMLVSIRDQMSQLLSRLEDPLLVEIAIGKMEGLTDTELAERHGCVRRTIVRKLGVIRSVWAGELGLER